VDVAKVAQRTALPERHPQAVPDPHRGLEVGARLGWAPCAGVQLCLRAAAEGGSVLVILRLEHFDALAQ